MSNDKKVFQFLPECHGDTRLLIFLKVLEKNINHAEGIHRVAKAMENQQKQFHKILIGLVDNDKKNTPRYFDDFIELKSEQNIILKQKPETNQYLLVLCPELEAWVLENARSVHINPTDFDLPADPKIMHDRVTQLTTVKDNENFTNFIKVIKKAGAQGFIMLQAWLDELQGKTW
jgi:hypothetical protein